jgi:hypothetical protein
LEQIIKMEQIMNWNKFQIWKFENFQI